MQIAQALHNLIRPGDTLWWGQATAEPLTLTQALVTHRQQIAQGGRLRVFTGIGVADTLRPEQADVFDFFGYAASQMALPPPKASRTIMEATDLVACREPIRSLRKLSLPST